MPLPSDFKEHNGLFALSGYDGNGNDVSCDCGGWFHVFREQPKPRPKGMGWCKCDSCGKESWQRVERSS